jgi:hypothetical protein
MPSINNPKFPSLSKPPDRDRFREKYVDQTIKTDFDGGYEHTRPRSKRVRKEWTVGYTQLPESDRSLLDDFIKNTAVVGGNLFDWFHPLDGMEYTVRFTKPPELEYEGFSDGPVYKCEFDLREV